ncbi:hypothetical protein [Streptomyces montanisoli]|uniref:Uncharacterized protein n=1 Tax=Streptomyces montanisoli TaxID=2798581 RepID=A0A940MAS4_9ACTN|nr:hypothetical protein [Streptomyces montanisoli]MBP0456237.1 hypothetical protein [Streptomyces montanisoli]
MVTIPGALADYITASNPTDRALAATLDAAHRGRGRTLVIEPTTTDVLHTISAYAEAILINRALHTPAERRAARAWIDRAGHAPAPYCAFHGARCDGDPRHPHHFPDVQLAPAAPTICPDFVTLDPADLIADELRTAAQLVTEAEATEGTWRGEWIGEQPTDGLFAVDLDADQGALFRD